MTVLTVTTALSPRHDVLDDSVQIVAYAQIIGQVVQGIVDHGKSPPSVSFWLLVWYHRSGADAISVGESINRYCSNLPLHPFCIADKTETPVPGSDIGVLGGRGWIARATLLKTAHWAVFALSSATAPQLFESTLESET